MSDRNKCTSCGLEWDKHTGIQVTCQNLLNEHARLNQLLKRLQDIKRHSIESYSDRSVIDSSGRWVEWRDVSKAIEGYYDE